MLEYYCRGFNPTNKISSILKLLYNCLFYITFCNITLLYFIVLLWYYSRGFNPTNSLFILYHSCTYSPITHYIVFFLLYYKHSWNLLYCWIM